MSASDPHPPARARKFLRRGVALLGAGALALAALPWLLSTRLFRPAAAFAIERATALPAELDGAEFSWRGPLVLHGLRLGPPRAGALTAHLEAERAELDLGLADLARGAKAKRIALDGARLRVVPGPAAPSIEPAVGEWLAAIDELTVRGAEVATADVASGRAAAVVLRSLEVLRSGGRLQRLDLAGTVASAAGEAPLRVRFERADDGAGARLEISARGVDLRALEPLWQTAYPGGVLAGRLELDTDGVLGPGRRLDLACTGSATGIDVRGPAYLPPEGFRESTARFAGTCAVDLDQARVACDGLHWSSSALELRGQGTFEPGAPSDLALELNANFDRLAQRFGRLLAREFHIGRLGGDLALRAEAAGAGKLELTADGDALAITLASGAGLGASSYALSCSLALDAAATELRIEDCAGSTSFGTFRGAARFQFAEPREREVELAVAGESRYLAAVLAGAFPPLPLLAGGNAELKLRASAGATECRASLALDGADLDLRYTDPAEREDTYYLRGAPLHLEAEASWPRGASAALERLSGRAALRAANGRVKLDEFAAVEAELRAAGGIISLDRLAADAYGGRVTACGQLWPGAPGAPRLALSASAEQVRVERFFASLVAAATGLTAATGGTFLVENTARLSGSVEVHSRGRGLTELLAAVSGTGGFELGGGAFQGSRLLIDLGAPQGRDALERIADGAAVRFALSPAGLELQSDSWIGVAGRRFRLSGGADWQGRLALSIPAEDLLAPDVVELAPDLWIPGLFGIGGAIDAPRPRLPVSADWKPPTGREKVEAAVRRLRDG